jgi:hypothetical protein
MEVNGRVTLSVIKAVKSEPPPPPPPPQRLDRKLGGPSSWPERSGKQKVSCRESNFIVQALYWLNYLGWSSNKKIRSLSCFYFRYFLQRSHNEKSFCIQVTFSNTIYQRKGIQLTFIKIQWGLRLLCAQIMGSVVLRDTKGQFTPISDMSVPYQCRPFSAPEVCERFYLNYMWRRFCVGHRTDGTDAELTCHWYLNRPLFRHCTNSYSRKVGLSCVDFSQYWYAITLMQGRHVQVGEEKWLLERQCEGKRVYQNNETCAGPLSVVIRSITTSVPQRQ